MYNEGKLESDVIINLGNHDDIVLAEVWKRRLQKLGINNVKIITKPEIVKIDGRDFLFVPGAHGISGPGNVAKNAFYGEKVGDNLYVQSKKSEENLLPTGFYIVKQADLNGNVGIVYEKLEEDKLNDFFDVLALDENEQKELFNKYQLTQEYLNLKRYLDDLEKRLKKENNDELKKQFEDLSNYLKQLESKTLGEEERKKVESYLSINQKLVEGSLYYHVNSKEVAEKFKDKELYGVISHDPIRYFEGLGSTQGIEIKKNFDFIYRFPIIRDGQIIDVIEAKIPFKKGEKYNFYFEFLPLLMQKISDYVLKKAAEKKLSEEDVEYFTNKLNETLSLGIEFYKEKGFIGETKIDVSDPYLNNLKPKLHLGGHLEGEWKVYELKDKPKRILNGEKASNLYANIHTKDLPKTGLYHIIEENNGSLLYKVQEFDKEKMKELIMSYFY